MIERGSAGKILSEMVDIGRTFQVAGRHSREQSLTGTKFAVLQQLRHGDARLRELSDRLHVSAPVASRAIDTLEASALVERRTDPHDARACLISITDHGRASFIEREDHVVDAFADALGDWSPTDAEQALQILRRLNTHLADVIEDPEPPAGGRSRPGLDLQAATADNENGSRT